MMKSTYYDEMLVDAHAVTVAALARFKLDRITNSAPTRVGVGIASLVGQAIVTHNMAVAMRMSALGKVLPVPNERDIDLHGALAVTVAKRVKGSHERLYGHDSDLVVK
jgi:hypothetical protein